MSNWHASSIRVALHRVFVQPALSPPRYAVAPPLPHRQRRLQCSEDGPAQALSKYQQKLVRRQQEQTLQQRSQQGTYTPGAYGPRRAHIETAQRALRPPQLPPLENRTYQVPYDEEIHAPFIAYIDRHGGFRPRTRLREVLKSLDRTQEHLVQMSPKDPADPQSLPTCRIFTKSELRGKRKQMDEKEKARKRQAGSAKAIEMYWVIEKKDLDMKLKQFTTFMSEGRVVDVVLEPKRRGRTVDPAACRQLLKIIHDAAGSVKGKERAPPEGVLGRKLTLKYHGHKEQQ